MMKRYFALFFILVLVVSAIAEELQMRVFAVYNGKQISIEPPGWTLNYDGTNWQAIMTSAQLGTNGLETSGRVKCQEADVETADPNRGLILTDSTTNKWVVIVDTNGTLSTVKITSSPEISFAERQKRIKERQALIEKARIAYKTARTDAERIKALADFDDIEKKAVTVVTP